MDSAGRVWTGANSSGNTTSEIYGDGSATFAGNGFFHKSVGLKNGYGAGTDAGAALYTRNAADDATTFMVNYDGSAYFRGNVQIKAPSAGAPLLTGLSTNGTYYGGNGMYPLVEFKHGYWGAQQTVAGVYVNAHGSGANSGYGHGDLCFYTGHGGNGDSGSTIAERMRIDSSGAIRTLSSSHLAADFSTIADASSYQQALQVVRNRTGIAAGGSAVFRVYTNGDAKNTNGVFTVLSDERLKENIVDSGSQWEDIKAVKIRKWNFAEATGNQTHTQIGPVAQELELTSPGLVYDYPTAEDEVVLDKDGNEMSSSKGVHQSVLYMKAVKALQEAMDRIETLEAKVAALEAG